MTIFRKKVWPMYYNYYPYEEDFDQYYDYDRQYPQGYFGPPVGGPPVGTPIAPPPAFSPPIPAWQQGPSGMRYCLFRNTYIWLRNGNSFWFFPTFVGRNIINGYRWRRSGWTFHVINPNNVRSYQCF
jgi:hypothetical protein